jgi:hypothetical protein
MLASAPAWASPEISGNITLEARGYFQAADQPEPGRGSLSISAEPEYYHPIGPHSVTITPYLRVDSADSERNQFDLREAYLLYVADRWELALGARKVFWGVTESQHLVDIINQTDQVSSPDGEDKLGQPMAQLTLPAEWGTLDLFALPYFRERTFPGIDGRLRGPLVVDTDSPIYESGNKAKHVDLAARYSHFIGPWDVALSHFSGTSREPELNFSGGKLIPTYRQIEQTGLEVQLVAGEWLLKTEAIHRTGFGPGYYAWVTGFEYTFVGVFGSAADLGVLSEWHRDSRGSAATTPFNHDIMTGLRLALNDAQSTEALLGVIADPVVGSHAVFLETSRRIGNQFRIELELRAFGGPPEDVIYYGIRNDDYAQANLAYYF